MKNIVLIGMPGCGKTTLGKMLAERLGMDFYDADDVLEEREPYTIKEFFAQGEDKFREAEQRTAEYLSQKSGCIIAAGGGVIKRSASMQAYQKSACIIFINRPPEAIAGDVEIKSRPLLADGVQRIFELYNERIDLYKKYADYTIDNINGVKDALKQLLQIAGEMKK